MANGSKRTMTPPGAAGHADASPHAFIPVHKGTVRTVAEPRYPTAAGILFGLGLGELFSETTFYLAAQAHGTRAGFSLGLAGRGLDSTPEGFFRVASVAFILGVFIALWAAARRFRLCWSTKQFIGTLLIGVGLFGMVKSLVSHASGLYQAHGTALGAGAMYWNTAFLILAAMITVAGLILRLAGRDEARRLAREAS